ncbi:MAG TPA: integrase family protein [Xanthobacteraceae bacterium]|jgi:integrase|nr:integrase family protein [Xanthobacteraceae bacterium]
MNPHRRTKRAARKAQLRELSVQKAKPHDEAYLIWDAKQRGLALRVQPTGAKSWNVIYSRQGRPRWLHLGDAGTIGLADAREMAAEAMLAVIKGKDPAAEKKAERGAGTFAELAEKYVTEYAEKHNKSWKQAAALVRRFAVPKWGKLQAASINRSDVKAMMARIEAPIVANQTLAAVSAIFTWGVKEEIVTANPCKLVDRNPTKDRERVLAESEIPVLWKALDDIDDAAHAAALRAILLLGQRPGECAHMRREHLKDGWWEMPGEEVEALGWPGTKNKESHRVWLPEPVRDIIAKLGNGAEKGFVFGKHGRPVRALDQTMRAVCAKLGVERATPHDLRRTHGSTITALSFGRDAMNRIQNHREGGIADVYDRHHYEGETKRIMEAVAAKIMMLAGRGAGENIISGVKFAR